MSILYAVQGERHERIPDALAAATVSRRQVMPWLCPDCKGTVAETVIDHVDDVHYTLRTVLPFEPVHHVEADRGGIPFFGPSNRAMRDKSPRRNIEKRRLEARNQALRDGGDVQADLATAIDVPLTFDTVCRSCPLRLRIQLPPR